MPARARALPRHCPNRPGWDGKGVPRRASQCLRQHKVVVLKQLRPDLAEDGDFAAMFVDESRVGRPTSITPMSSMPTRRQADAGQYYLAMKLFFWKAKRWTRSWARWGDGACPFIFLHLSSLAQVLKGLRYAHELQRLRRLAPSASFTAMSRRRTCSSPATARSSCSTQGILAKTDPALAQTQRGMLKGKVGYTSPEQCRGQTVDVRADVYSMGVMVWEAIAGCRRAAGETHLAALHARLQNVEAPISQRCSPRPRSSSCI